MGSPAAHISGKTEHTLTLYLGGIRGGQIVSDDDRIRRKLVDLAFRRDPHEILEDPFPDEVMSRARSLVFIPYAVEASDLQHDLLRYSAFAFQAIAFLVLRRHSIFKRKMGIENIYVVPNG
jgi:hypothetical protein